MTVNEIALHSSVKTIQKYLKLDTDKVEDKVIVQGRLIIGLQCNKNKKR